MLRSFTSLATSWLADRLLRRDVRLAVMDDATAQTWASCIPVWTKKLPNLDPGQYRPWLHTIYRHGHKMSQDPEFWKTMQKAVTKFSRGDLDWVMLQAGLFNNPMPFLHFEPYEDNQKNVLGETQIVTGMVQYMRSTFNHGTHPALGKTLEDLGMDPAPRDWGLFNLPIRMEGSLFSTRADNTENYWRFFHGEDDFPIECIIDYYKSMLSLNPSDTAYASWAHAAWDARRTNTCLQRDAHWETFEREIRPLYEQRVDWELIAAYHGFLLSPDNLRNGEIASYAQHHLARKVNSMDRPQQPDAVAFGMLSISEPTCPWDTYMLFTSALEPGAPIESYPLDFN